MARASHKETEKIDHQSDRALPGTEYLNLGQKAEKRYPIFPPLGGWSRVFPLGDMVVNMLSLTALFLTAVGLEPTVGPRY